MIKPSISPNGLRSFASDNFAGVHPQILEFLTQINTSHAPAYGNDALTEEARKKFCELFKTSADPQKKEIDVYFVFNGTAANVLGLKTLTRPYHAIVCADTAHIAVDECGAPEAHTGCKLVTVATPDGKLTPKNVEAVCTGLGDQHHSQIKVISISQTTEMGTLYTPAEVRALATFAHSKNFYLHMDGSRIGNATAALSCPVAEFTKDAGVDVLSFGGTKNGALAAEAVIFFNPKLSSDFKFIRKQGMQLSSKMRFIAAQFIALLSNELWLKNARHANKMAKLLEASLEGIDGIELTQKVQANAVFASIPVDALTELQAHSFFYPWGPVLQTPGGLLQEVRWMCSFDTTEEDIKNFVAVLKKKFQGTKV